MTGSTAEKLLAVDQRPVDQLNELIRSPRNAPQSLIRRTSGISRTLSKKVQKRIAFSAQIK